MDTVSIDSIVIKERQRKDFGDIDGLAKSIQEVGLIQPIVLTFAIDGEPLQEYITIIAGHRRFLALKKLGWTKLVHGESFIWKSDLAGNEPGIIYKRKAAELEENVRRKSLTWVEEIKAKQELLTIYQSIYGAPSGGRPTIGQAHGTVAKGFGVRSLATLLGESEAQTSTDLELAALITKIPALEKEDSREGAKRKIDLAVKTFLGQKYATGVAKALEFKILITCESEDQQKTLLEQLRGAGLKCQAIVA